MEVDGDTRAKIETAASLGLTQEKIALLFGLSESTLQRRCALELRRGTVKADLAVMQNLFRIACGNTAQAVSAAIFWAKVRMRWHEVQRVIHGFDPELLQVFVKQVVEVLRRMLPESCPHCKTRLDLRPKIAAELRDLSRKMTEHLPPSQIEPIQPQGVTTNDAEGASKGAQG